MLSVEIHLGGEPIGKYNRAFAQPSSNMLHNIHNRLLEININPQKQYFVREVSERFAIPSGNETYAIDTAEFRHIAHNFVERAAKVTSGVMTLARRQTFERIRGIKS